MIKNLNDILRQNLSKINFITPFYSQSHDHKSLINGLDSISNSEKIFISAIPFYSSKPPIEFFQRVRGNSRNISLIKANEDVQLYELKYSYRKGPEKKEESGRVFVYENPEYKKVYVSFTIESNKFFREALLPLIQNNHPRLIMTFIKHKKLMKLLKSFQIDNDFTDIIINRASYRLRFEDKKIVPGINWPNMNLKDAFDWVYQNNGWFNSIHFKVLEYSTFSTDVYFTRNGIVRTNHYFLKVFKSFIIPICKIIYENIEIFGNRSRRYNNYYAKPLAIDFGIEQFTDKSENDKFIQAMKKYKKSSISVLHGNPYIHMSVIDYLDGSTFDIWVVNSSQLVIVPQMKGSIPAIKRLINHIFDTYAEGGIKDYKEVVK